MKKLRLRIETLAVESFQTGREQAKPGTVRAHGDDCTWFESCLCETAYYYCGTGPATMWSCGYTQDERCGFDTKADGCGGTQWEICGTGTPPEYTPAC
ncbi:MAG TPA: hypothetical protein VGX50_08620 [Longimicrobium sp.]|jgi:hypothetical protein|nr:hypothetical protein [Longimicrobium sp.]